MNSTATLKETSEDGVPSCGDNTRNPIFHSVRKLREFWTRWQNKENKVLTGSLNDNGSHSEDPRALNTSRGADEARVPWRSEGASSRSALERRPVPRCRRLRELARKVSSRFSSSVNDVDDVAIAGGSRDPDLTSSEEYSAAHPFLREAPSEFSCHAFSSVLSHHSVTESTIEAYADVSLEMAHRLQSRTSRSRPGNTVFPSNLFRRSSLELSRSSYRKLKTTSTESEDLP
ncbi:hypothetical protein V5799_022729 [Amblyomma americanum]|uniref:Uncharacterized protein n=1 Tax=Amblyomma americanum TaxID=6943 RepID=A0AAQ4FK80_AMBAM